MGAALADAAAGRRVAVAESCTGGLVAKRITDLSGYAVDPSAELAPDFFVEPRRS